MLDVMDDVTEQMEEMTEITDALSMGFGGVDVMEDDDLLGELDGLEEEMLDEELAGMGAVPAALPVGMAMGGAVAARKYTSNLQSLVISRPFSDRLLVVTAAPAVGMSEEDQEMARLEAEMAMMVPAS